ncbi:MAG: 16S rRNA (guanine(966)-N(2))-methyltransferase RsmD [Oscillospiraceae bacterium]|nr:16S rRNA (guanine(966)-N(2))-methyltransferase RsmD [Oscillospiraceae bacterium]
MRIISGTARGRKLKEPIGSATRPTSDMVKESVFNIIQFDIEGRKVLDLFAGTGQLGIEALSRGASEAVFVDNSQDAVKLIWSNLNTCEFSDSAKVLAIDALRYLEREEQFDIIFLDPPYGSDLIEKTLAKIIEFDKLNANGIIICEIRADSVTPDVKSPYFLHKEYKYGRVKILRYERTLSD